MQSLEHSLRVAIDSKAGARGQPDGCPMEAAKGRSRFSSSSLLLLLPALMRKVSKVHRNTWQGLEGGTGRQWTECRQCFAICLVQ